MDWDVYLDDILISSTNRARSQAATKTVIHALQAAGFIINEKSIVQPQTKMGFLGKFLDLHTHAISYETAMLASTMCLWLLPAGRGRIHPRDMARLLGRLRWVSHPIGASSPFLAGAYAAMHARINVFSWALARATTTSLCLQFHPIPSPHLHLGV